MKQWKINKRNIKKYIEKNNKKDKINYKIKKYI